MPAPSPVLASQPQAPRWLRLINTVRASRMILCDFLPLILTTNPTRKESCRTGGHKGLLRRRSDLCGFFCFRGFISLVASIYSKILLFFAKTAPRCNNRLIFFYRDGRVVAMLPMADGKIITTVNYAANFPGRGNVHKRRHPPKCLRPALPSARPDHASGAQLFRGDSGAPWQAMDILRREN